MAQNPYTPSLLVSNNIEEIEIIGGSDVSRGNNNTKLSPSAFDQNQYRTENLQYPADLLGNRGEYGGNYVVFYINVAADSKLARGPQENFVNIDQSNRERSVTVGQAERLDVGARSLQAVQGIFSGVSGTPVGGGFVGFGAGLLSGEAVKSQAATFQGATKRLKTAIALHMPNLGMQTRYGVNYEEKDFLLEGAVLEAGISGGSALLKAITKGEINELKNVSGTVGTAAGLNLPGGALSQKLTGLAPNPRREQLFRSVDFRTFQMTYEFYPRDEKEAQNVQDIIKQFKYHMHPEFKDTSQFLYVYPSEFDIVYYHGTEENTKVNKHTSCVLTEVNINYAPQGQFTSFADGTPTQINLVLSFRELVPLSKETIDRGL